MGLIVFLACGSEEPERKTNDDAPIKHLGWNAYGAERERRH